MIFLRTVLIIPVIGKEVRLYNGLKTLGFKSTMVVFSDKYFFRCLEKDLKSTQVQTAQENFTIYLL